VRDRILYVGREVHKAGGRGPATAPRCRGLLPSTQLIAGGMTIMPASPVRKFFVYPNYSATILRQRVASVPVRARLRLLTLPELRRSYRHLSLWAGRDHHISLVRRGPSAKANKRRAASGTETAGRGLLGGGTEAKMRFIASDVEKTHSESRFPQLFRTVSNAVTPSDNPWAVSSLIGRAVAF
jgi:hypothetical protein